jgi:hypothetical protein
MRRIRIAAATLACVGAALLALAAPAHAAPQAGGRPAVSAAFHFGTYYTLEACEYFGQSLVAGPQFSSYHCTPYRYPNDPQRYWALYVYA